MRLVVAITLVTVLKIFSVSASLQKPKRYDNFVVYKISIDNFKDRNIINNLLNQSSEYNLWYSSRTEVHIMVNPNVLETFKRTMLLEKMLMELLIPNVQALIDAQKNVSPISKNNCSIKFINKC